MMKFSIQQAKTDTDWDFFFALSFETLKTMANRRSMYDQLVEANPGMSDAELLAANRKEMGEYTDFSDPTESLLPRMMVMSTVATYGWEKGIALIIGTFRGLNGSMIS